MSEPLHLLAFGAHPDDVELSCGGWLAAAGAAGHGCGIVDLSAGEKASNGTVQERAAEAAEAARILGLVCRENLGLPDAGIDGRNSVQVDAVVEVLRRLRPGLVCAPWVQSRHPDHGEAGELVKRAVFLAGLLKHRPDLGSAFRPTRLLHYAQRHEAVADFVVDVSAVYAVKEQAVAAHSSQFTRRRSAAETLINSSVGERAFEARDRYWGATIGVAYGEPYVLSGPVPLADPITHFAEHPQPPVLVPVK